MKSVPQLKMQNNFYGFVFGCKVKMASLEKRYINSQTINKYVKDKLRSPLPSSTLLLLLLGCCSAWWAAAASRILLRKFSAVVVLGALAMLVPCGCGWWW